MTALITMPVLNLPATSEIKEKIHDTFEGYFDKIEEEIANTPADVSTEKGRDAIRSLAYKIARTKTGLDDAAKDLTEGQRALIDTVNEERKAMRARLDQLKVEARKPLTDWEEAEAKRNAIVNTSFEGLNTIMSQHADGVLVADMTSIQLFGYVGQLETQVVDNNVFGERSVAYRELLDQTVADLKERAERLKKEEEDRAELERLRAEREAREAAEIEAKRKADEEARIEADRKRMAAEAARIAEREAQEKIDAERRRAAEAEQRAEQAERDRLAAIKQAEADRIAAEEKAEADRVEALRKAEADKIAAIERAEAEEKQRVFERQAAERKAEQEKQEAIEADRQKRRDAELLEQAAKEAREADIEHRRKINAAAVAALVKVSDISETDAKTLIKAIAEHKVPNVTIGY